MVIINNCQQFSIRLLALGLLLMWGIGELLLQNCGNAASFFDQLRILCLNHLHF